MLSDTQQTKIYKHIFKQKDALCILLFSRNALFDRQMHQRLAKEASRHNAPYPRVLLGYTFSILRGLAPSMSTALSFSPYIYGSFPLIIPHSISKAALPVTKGVAMEVPERRLYPPPGEHEVMLTPGATRSGFI
jgi:hypothetical protein